MRRGKRIVTITLPYSDPERVVYTVPVGIPVEIPQPQKVPLEAPKLEPKKEKVIHAN